MHVLEQGKTADSIIVIHASPITKWSRLLTIDTNNLPMSPWDMGCHLWVQSLILIVPGISLGMRPANERRRYIVTMSLIGWEHN